MTVFVSDVATELARPIPGTIVVDQWQSWIDRAYRLIERRLGATKYAALDPLVLDEAVLLAVSAHVRAWRDTSASRRTVSVDDGSVSYQYEESVGALTIPDDLWETLDPSAGMDGAFTITPFGEPDPSPLETWA